MLIEKLSIFTSTYNRSYTLTRLYESLRSQTSNDFVWLIIDDGSTDDTGQLVQEWQKQNLIAIQYVYKENGGLHTGYNKAIELIETELCMCIDSDDWLPTDAVEKIVSHWRRYKSDKVAGILGLDFTADGQPLGGYLPENVMTMKFIELGYKYHHFGDVKMVHRTDLLKAVAPMPTYGKERYFNPIYLFHQIDIHYPLLVLNDNLCFVEYQENGMSRNIYSQYVDSPRSFSELRKMVMRRTDIPLFLKYRNAIHYVSSQIMLGNSGWLQESPEKLLTILAAPLGLLLYCCIKIRTAKLS